MEMMRRAYEAFASGDMETVFSIVHPDAEMAEHREFPGARSYRGHDGLVAAIANQQAVWEDFKMIPSEYVPVGEDIVVVLHTQSGRSRATGLFLEAPYAHVWTIEDGRAVKAETYGSWEEGLAAARDR